MLLAVGHSAHLRLQEASEDLELRLALAPVDQDSYQVLHKLWVVVVAKGRLT